MPPGENELRYSSRQKGKGCISLHYRFLFPNSVSCLEVGLDHGGKTIYRIFRLSAPALINFTETQTRRLIETRRLLSSTSVNDYNDTIYWTYTIRGPLILITEFCHPCATYYRYYPLATYSAQLRPFFV